MSLAALHEGTPSLIPPMALQSHQAHPHTLGTGCSSSALAQASLGLGPKLESMGSQIWLPPYAPHLPAGVSAPPSLGSGDTRPSPFHPGSLSDALPTGGNLPCPQFRLENTNGDHPTIWDAWAVPGAGQGEHLGLSPCPTGGHGFASALEGAFPSPTLQPKPLAFGRALPGVQEAPASPDAHRGWEGHPVQGHARSGIGANHSALAWEGSRAEFPDFRVGGNKASRGCKGNSAASETRFNQQLVGAAGIPRHKHTQRTGWHCLGHAGVTRWHTHTQRWHFLGAQVTARSHRHPGRVTGPPAPLCPGQAAPAQRCHLFGDQE